ncbi:HupE/UreJ family protein [Rhodobacteraceae bacterium M382]|nr:HupE/UreJ family protein [Rhodobacteraceae bacterium M382]
MNLNVRILHIEHVESGLRVYYRTPMPYLVADKVGKADGDDLPLPAPFTTNAFENDQLVHYVDPGAILRDGVGLGQIAEAGLSLKTGGTRQTGVVEQVLVYRVGAEPGFATLEEARTAMQSAMSLDPPPYVGDAVADITIRYDLADLGHDYTISSTLDPGLPDQENTANLILDYGSDKPQVFRSSGLMYEPIVIRQGGSGGFWSFVVEGVHHILAGLDHVLFVICLVLGAGTLRTLLQRITGFTVGHSVTLSLGFFGYVPSADWFIPAVETGIALSIIYAAWMAIRADHVAGQSDGSILVVTTLIGLLHGLGFSFVLQEILQVSAPNIWQSLLAFNLGVEIGQVMIVLLLWPALMFLHRRSATGWRYVATTLAAACIVLAIYWVVERSIQVVAAMA